MVLRRFMLAASAGVLVSLLFGAALASAKTLNPNGEATAHRVGPSFFNESHGSSAPRAFPLHKEHPSRLDQLKQRAARQSQTGTPTTPLSPAAVSLNADGLKWSDNASYNLGTPPDATGAIGPDYYFENVNSVVRTYSRTTLAGQGTATQLDVFTGPTGKAVFDPQVQWDQSANRWIYSAISDDGAPATDWILFGWSKTANPTGDMTSSSWCKYAINTGAQFDDYDKLGHDANHIIIGSNVFTGN